MSEHWTTVKELTHFVESMPHSPLVDRSVASTSATYRHARFAAAPAAAAPVSLSVPLPAGSSSASTSPSASGASLSSSSLSSLSSSCSSSCVSSSSSSSSPLPSVSSSSFAFPSLVHFSSHTSSLSLGSPLSSVNVHMSSEANLEKRVCRGVLCAAGLRGCAVSFMLSARRESGLTILTMFCFLQ